MLRSMRAWLSIVFALLLLFLGANTALYFIRLKEVEGDLRVKTEMALVEKLSEAQPGRLRVEFDGRDGVVSGQVGTTDSADAVRAAVESIALAGELPQLRSLTHEIKRRPELEIWLEDGRPFLRAYLAESTLNKVRSGVRNALGAFPGARDEQGSEGPPVQAMADAAVPPWEGRVEEFVEYFFFQDAEGNRRVDQPRLRIIDGHELNLQGRAGSSDEAWAIDGKARDCFPSLAEHVLNRIIGKQDAEPLIISQGPDNAVTIEGMVQQEPLRERILEAFRELGAQGQFFNNAIAVSPRGFSDVPWLDGETRYLKEILHQIGTDKVDKVRLIIGPGTIAVGGETPSTEIHARIGRLLEEDLPSYQVHYRMTMTPDDVNPLAEDETNP